MVENLSTVSNVSHQALSDLRLAFRSYSQNSNSLSENTDETKSYFTKREITRKALTDIQETFPMKIDTDNESEIETDTKTDENVQMRTQTQSQSQSQSLQVNSSQTQETNSITNIKAKQYTLPKNTDTIISELKRDGLHKTMSVYDIADKYSISYMKAREILDKLNKDNNGFIREYNLPQNSTISFKV